MKKAILIILVVVVCGISYFAPKADAESGAPVLVYRIPDISKWSRDHEMDTEIVGPKHFYFSDTDNIDLNIVPIDDDLQKSLASRGTDVFVKEALGAKNMINRMFTVGESELVDFKLQSKAGIQELQMRCKQNIEGLQIQTLEKYFIVKGQALHAELRWQNNSDMEKVKQATKLFSEMTVSLASGAKK